MNNSLRTQKLKLYLDTSVISAAFDERNPERLVKNNNTSRNYLVILKFLKFI